MSDAIRDAAMKKARKMNDELNELRRKTKHQEAALRTLTQELARLEKGGDSYESRRLQAENETLRAENQKLRNDLANSGGGWRQGGSCEDADPRAAARQHLDKQTPLLSVWKKYSKSAVVQDNDAGRSQAQRYCDALELYASVRDEPLRSDDVLCESIDPVDDRNQRRVLHGLVLWAQMGRST